MTAQAPDKIIYKGKEHSIHTNPLESYFDKYPDKRPGINTRCSGLWRGYVATFEITNDRLFLKDIEIMLNGYTKDEQGNNRLRWKSVINEVFPNHNVVKLDWWTGTLVLPSGELIDYVHMGYMSTYEYYTLLEINNGDLVAEKQMGYEEYNAFEYKRLKTKYHDEGWSDKVIEILLHDIKLKTSTVLVEHETK